MIEMQPELFPKPNLSAKDEIQAYKKEIFNSIRGLYARNSEMKKSIDKMKTILEKAYKIKVDSKIVVFESNLEEDIESLLSIEKEFLDSELMQYVKMTENSMNNLKFKYNESERMITSLNSVLMNAIFKEMENRAQA